MGKILAYTVSYGSRAFLKDLVPRMRGTSGVWFDWLVCIGNPNEELESTAQTHLHHPLNRGIQYLISWPENRGQHFATKAALKLARERDYTWLLRLDDDLKPKTKKWLKKLVDHTLAFRKAAGAKKHQIVASPKILGLRNPLEPLGVSTLKGLDFSIDVMDILGGACRLHRVEFLKDYEPPLQAPLGRKDPQHMAGYILENEGIMVRYPGIRMIHKTDEIEAKDTADQELQRKMGYYWPYLGPTEDCINENASGS